ncbi:hypothetical protein [Leptothermofonsia sp. ETS-13]|uniref:hypothetical protein n=1 Tax=Leptothermofonsia sp. ETS-13 TaxID=3035696 RepID=UPI003BA01E91
MASYNGDDWLNSINGAIADTIKASQEIADRVRNTADAAGKVIGANLYEFVEQGTETIGKVVSPIAENPLVQFATKVPVINWLAAALGQVDVAAVERDVNELRLKYPLDTDEQLAQRVMVNTAWKAAGVGLVTNVVPPLAVTLFAIDLGAIAALQAEMLYRIATIYRFSPTDPTRRGEVLALWGLSTGSSGLLKTGLSFVEFIPALGALVGVSGDAGLIYSMGYLACRFYEAKRKSGGDTNELS